MSKSIKRRLAITLVFVGIMVLNYLEQREPVVFVYGFILLFITLIAETFLYSKRGLFLYALAGTIAGFFAGRMFYELLNSISPSLFPTVLGNYVILGFATLGFLMPFMSSQRSGYALNFPLSPDPEKKALDIKLLDTSVIIDGRIADIAETGFLTGTLILPKFVLNEIQALADSKDPIKRSRARRGLDILNKLKELVAIDLKIYTRDYPEAKGVDAKLILLAKEMGASIITNDYNLNKVAKLDGIMVLNLNDLANTLKPVLIPGEEMELDVLKEGKESNQGVGYLNDGTMVVVANGSSYIGKKINVKVTSILQTSAGVIIFTEPKK